MEMDYKAVIARADKDAVQLGDNKNVFNATEAAQRLYDETSSMPLGRQEFFMNQYVKEANKKANDIYGTGKHIELEIVDKNHNDKLDLGDIFKATGTDHAKSESPVSALRRENNSY